MKRKAKKILKTSLGGVAIGIVNGLFASGGGMIAVPIIKNAGQIDDKTAHATAVLTMFPICLISAASYLFAGKVDGNIVWPVMVGSLVGGIVGTFALSRLKNKVISVIFSVVMIAAGIILIIKN